MKLTGWYSGNQKPVRKGVYERYYKFIKHRVYCKWNGEFWFSPSYSANEAILSKFESVYQDLPWQGLAK